MVIENCASSRCRPVNPGQRRVHLVERDLFGSAVYGVKSGLSVKR